MLDIVPDRFTQFSRLPAGFGVSEHGCRADAANALVGTALALRDPRPAFRLTVDLGPRLLKPFPDGIGMDYVQPVAGRHRSLPIYDKR